MRQSTFRWKKVKKWLAMAGLFLCLLVAAVPVYAEDATTTAATTETTAETTAAVEPETKKEPETTKEAEPEKKEPEAVKEETPTQTLPTGNLTLIDDVISASDAHREFLTVVSKDGSYFYIVIDRDMEGAGNVYFLNLVDNQDLYKLTGEAAPAIVKTEPVVSMEQEQQEEKMAEKQEVEPTEEEKAAQKQKSLMITVGVGAAIVVGVVIYILKKKKSKQTTKQEFDLSDFDDDDE